MAISTESSEVTSDPALITEIIRVCYTIRRVVGETDDSVTQPTTSSVRHIIAGAAHRSKSMYSRYSFYSIDVLTHFVYLI